ncbi:MAG: universal stress protein [Actinomycetota bacterium]
MAGVVVGVHHADTSGTAVRWASTAAGLRGLPLTLVHAWNEPLDVTVDLDPEFLPDLLGPATSCAAHGPTEAVLLAGHPDLLVLGLHHGARHLNRLTRSCLNHVTCPVVVVPHTGGSSTGRIVVGVCGTPASDAALRWAAEEALLRRARLVVCYVWQVHPGSVQDVLHRGRVAPAQAAAARERIDQWVQQVLGPCQIETQVTHGGPLDGLLDQSARADLIVVGRNVHRRLSRLLHGAVSDDLSGLAPCPVVVTPGVHATAPRTVL